MQFSKIYTDEVILSGISPTIPRTSYAIAGIIGAHPQTTERALFKLETAGKVKRIETETGNGKIIKGWLRCE